MAIISFTIPDTALPRFVDALCGLYGYQELVDSGSGDLVANPESKGQFARRMTREHWVRDRVRDWERQQQFAAAQAAVTDIEVS